MGKIEDLKAEGKRLGVYDNKNSLCLVTGCSGSLISDCQSFQYQNPYTKFDIISVNASILQVLNPKYWCSKHPMNIIDDKLREKRIELDWENNFKTHSPNVKYFNTVTKQQISNALNHIDYVWNSFIEFGSSVMFAIGCAVGMGYRGIVLCGVGLTRGYGIYRRYFEDFNRKYPNIIRCMSGLLVKDSKRKGSIRKPDKEWISRVLVT